MAYCRTLVPFRGPGSPGTRLRPLLEQLGLVVEEPDHGTLMAFEPQRAGRGAHETVRIWADWSHSAGTGTLWLETLCGDGLSRQGSRCAALLERIRTGLSR